MIRLLISDDSAFMRIAIRKMVESEPDIEVVGEAKTGQMCVEMAQNLKPDVITMDVEMPVGRSWPTAPAPSSCSAA